MKYLLLVSSLVAALFVAAGTASASVAPPQHQVIVLPQHHGQGDYRAYCDDGVTKFFVGSRLAFARFLAYHEGLTAGQCAPIELPPVVIIDETPPPVVLAEHANDAFLFCYSQGATSDPQAHTISEYLFLTHAAQPELGGKPYWTYGAFPTANHVVSKTPLGNGWYAHCDASTAPVIGHITSDGMPISSTDWPKVQDIWHMALPYGYLNVTA